MDESRPGGGREHSAYYVVALVPGVDKKGAHKPEWRRPVDGRDISRRREGPEDNEVTDYLFSVEESLYLFNNKLGMGQWANTSWLNGPETEKMRESEEFRAFTNSLKTCGLSAAEGTGLLREVQEKLSAAKAVHACASCGDVNLDRKYQKSTINTLTAHVYTDAQKLDLDTPIPIELRTGLMSEILGPWTSRRRVVISL